MRTEDVVCEFTECKHNRNGCCVWLKENGKSTTKGANPKVVMCAWYDRGQPLKCDMCFYSTPRTGKIMCMCDKFKQLIPPGRFACEEFKNDKYNR